MNRQSLILALLLCNVTVFASFAEAGIFRRRSNNSQSNYTYRPAAKPATQPTAAQPAAQPAKATVRLASTTTTTAAKVEVKPASATVQSFPSTILNMLSRNNAIRTSRGMRAMSLSNRLTAAAQNHANYMARTGGFSHYSNGGPQGRASMYGFRGGVRENIAMGQPSVDGAFATWTASGGHYANMMSHSDVAGFGYAVGSNGQAYWVAVYGSNDGGN